MAKFRMLREQIAKLIRDNPDQDKAAIEICMYRESRIDLRGNGWFDDDQIMQKALDTADECAELWLNVRGPWPDPNK